jgi:prepilin-type N-terminal cleavage/methylation domain-containing protein
MLGKFKEIQRRKAAGELEDGFTLIELLIVIVVLGILAAVVLLALGGVTGQSAQAACKSDASSLNTAMAAFSANNPGVAATGGASGNLATTGAGWVGGPYLQQGTWPSNGTHYAFSIAAGVLQIAAPSSATAVPYTSSSCASVQ